MTHVCILLSLFLHKYLKGTVILPQHALLYVSHYMHIFLCVFVVYVFVCKTVYKGAHAFVHVKARVEYWMLLLDCSLYIYLLRQSLLLNLTLINHVTWADQGASGICLSPSTEVTNTLDFLCLGSKLKSSCLPGRHLTDCHFSTLLNAHFS